MEGLDRNTKRALLEELSEQQDKIVQERESNLQYFREDFRRPALPKDLNCEVKRIQKFINLLKFASDNDSLVEECLQLNLRMHIPDVIKNISQSKLGPNERDLLL